ncbi:glycosyltransferase [Ramlibacter tataouinensis]|uniref:A-glycosyltransferase, Glycosyltransferase Family 4-like protein n=1 Tax=Ramlibacter tataouinensis (strain ATCC BAA-407 / DSM 14655 / LMG 21543 / TTB310) TaxID=365046 RepID=F5XYW9_RAMTT|nr:glycosyltransferase [Ramlibacter tataouinensis]AEG91957.1 a-glycosyltransferase, Glycosyltransferase Family 4-like protein [Ramlibacter tataouinensis TTB310]
MKHSLDALVVREGRLFAYGWLFHPVQPTHELALRVTLEDGASLHLPVTAGKERSDVAAAFPSEPQARWSGWMAYVGWSYSRPHRIELLGTVKSGEPFVVLVDGVPAARASLNERLRTFVRRARRQWKGQATVDAEQAEGEVAGDEEALAAVRVAMKAAGLQRLCLVIDHAMGGGANHYRKEWVTHRLTELPLLAVMTFDVHRLSYGLELQTSTGHVLRMACSGNLPAALAASGLVHKVFYNDAVSFPRAGEVPAWLQAFVAAGASLTVAVHDYLAVCPSPFLLNDANTFCGVPPIEECMRCMRCNDNAFPTVRPAPDMVGWRSTWGDALAVADAILCFSASSQDLLLRAYPRLDRTRIRVVPHEVRRFTTQVHHLGEGPLHVGVVGAISMHKGAGVLKALAREIEARGAPVRITVFGTLEGAVAGDTVTVTGAYERDELPGLIERSGANVFLLPSICPETFSYVTHELVQLALPVACFDLGAPADCVAQYKRGRVLRQRGAAALLDDLIAFHRDIHILSLQRDQ